MKNADNCPNEVHDEVQVRRILLKGAKERVLRIEQGVWTCPKRDVKERHYGLGTIFLYGQAVSVKVWLGTNDCGVKKKDGRWWMPDASREPKFLGRPLEAAWRKVGESGSVSGVHSEEDAGARTLGGGDELQTVRCQAGRRRCQSLSHIDHEGAKPCAITGMFVGNVSSQNCGTSTLRSMKVL